MASMTVRLVGRPEHPGEPALHAPVQRARALELVDHAAGAASCGLEPALPAVSSSLSAIGLLPPDVGVRPGWSRAPGARRLPPATAG